MMEHNEIIKALGGPSKLARRLGVKQPRVSMWKARGIPGEFKPAIYELARQAGLEDKIDKEKFFGFWPKEEAMEA